MSNSNSRLRNHVDLSALRELDIVALTFNARGLRQRGGASVWVKIGHESMALTGTLYLLRHCVDLPIHLQFRGTTSDICLVHFVTDRCPYDPRVGALEHGLQGRDRTGG